MLLPDLAKLVHIAGPARSPRRPVLAADGGLKGELATLAEVLGARNGFVAFEPALEVFPSDPGLTLSLEQWNDPSGWRSAYPAIPPDMLFFAHDIFGGPFAIWNGSVHRMDPETGITSAVASSLDTFAAVILGDYNAVLGYPLAHAWQSRHGALAEGRRLAPKIPFVLGGEFTLDNLYDADPAALMRFRGDLAHQIADLPDGTPVTLKFGD